MSRGAILPSNVAELNARPPVRTHHPSKARLLLLLVPLLLLGVAFLVLGAEPFAQAGAAVADAAQHGLANAERMLAARSRTPSAIEQNGSLSANLPAQVLASLGILAAVALLLRVLRGH